MFVMVITDEITKGRCSMMDSWRLNLQVRSASVALV